VVLDKCYPVLNIGAWVSAIDAQLQTIKTYLINAALKQGCLSTARSLPWLMVPAIAGPSYQSFNRIATGSSAFGLVPYRQEIWVKNALEKPLNSL